MRQINKLLVLSLLLLFCKGSIYSQNMQYDSTTIQTPNNTTVNVGILKTGVDFELTPQQKKTNGVQLKRIVKTVSTVSSF